jgi:pimeloyl-ACP methyl ester carboxylesterase
MQPEEVVAIGELAGAALAEITAQIEGIHEGIARRVFSSAGPIAAPARLIHDAVAAGVYRGVRRSVAFGARSGARALSFSIPPDAPSLQQGPAGRTAIGVLNGVIGDTLHHEGNALALSMALRHGGSNIEPSPASLRAASPDATPRLVVFVHGLCETEDVWSIGSDRHVPYGPRLRAEIGYTPLYVRYNTGRGVEESGRELASLLHEVVTNWPTEVHHVALIGHAMGGLVAGSACDQGNGQPWTDKVVEVLTLGSPRWGAPLERAAQLAGGMLGRARETERLSRALAGRSVAIKQLRSGKVSSPPRGRHHVLDYRRFGAVRHFDILNHPEIYEQIRTLLSPRPALPAPRLGLPAPRETGAPQRP